MYSYCRWADDLADEIGDVDESLRLLAWWGTELDRMYQGEAQHPVFVALRGTVKKYGIPQQPFADLIRAFIQDQTVTRYQTWDAVLDYCVYSANPVGTPGAVSLWIFRCGKAALVGCDMHGSATGEFLARRDGRPTEGPRLSAARFTREE